MTPSATQRSVARHPLFVSLMALAAVAGLGVDLLCRLLVHHDSYLLAPQRQVEHYLDAVVAGDVKTAVKLGRVNAAGGEELLTSAVYKNVPDRVTSYSISKTAVHGDKAIVTAVIKQGDDSYVNTFTLHRASALLGVVPNWRLDAQVLPSIVFTVNAPGGTEVKGAGVALGTDVYVFVLPGEYTFQLVGTAYFSAPDQNVDIGGFGVSGAMHGERKVTLQSQLTAQGILQAEKAVTTFLANCLAQNSAEPADCPFALDVDPGATYTRNVWTLDQPIVSEFGIWKNGPPTGWAVSTVAPGMVDYDGVETSGPERGEIYTDPFPFGIGGYVDSFDAQGNADFVFTGSDYDAETAGGATS